MSTDPRHLSLADRCILALDAALAAAATRPATASRPSPASSPEADLSPAQQRHSAGLMRVNHAGEIAAQALYYGQAIGARDRAVRDQMYQAAAEENDHLAWCQARLAELGAAPSVLAPVWYCGSLAIGAAAGAAGDRWSLGFIAETEKQVVEHLEGHFEALPPDDRRSREIVAQMRRDEARHGREAVAAGAAPLPPPLKSLMKLTARIMTSTAYYV